MDAAESSKRDLLEEEKNEESIDDSYTHLFLIHFLACFQYFQSCFNAKLWNI